MRKVDSLCLLIFSLVFSPSLSGPVSPDGYHQLLGLNYYKFHGELAPSWERARQVCIEEGAHLAVLNSEEEARVLSGMFTAANVSVGVAYIGFHDMFAEGVYVTIFDQSIQDAGFSRWMPGQPDDESFSPENRVEDCGGINRDGGGLHDLKCNSGQPFICERV